MCRALTRCGDLGRNLALDVDETRGIVQTLVDFPRRHIQQGRKLGALLRGILHLLRDRPDRLHRRADGERLAVAVGDHAARGADVDHAAVARLAFLLQEIVVQTLQVYGARRRARGTRRRSAQAARASATAAGAAPAPDWRRSSLARPCRRGHHHLDALRHRARSYAGARARSSRRAHASPRCFARAAAAPTRHRAAWPVPARARVRRTAFSSCPARSPGRARRR